VRRRGPSRVVPLDNRRVQPSENANAAPIAGQAVRAGAALTGRWGASGDKAGFGGMGWVRLLTSGLKPSPADRLLTGGAAILLCLSVLVAAMLRLALVASAPAFMLLPDSADFLSAGLRLAEGDEFDLPLKRAPLYPVFIGGVVLARGAADLEMITLVQHLLGLGTVVLVYFLGALTFGRGVGLLAALGTAVNGSLLLMEHTINAEAVFTPMLLLGLVLTLLILRERGSGRPPLSLSLAAGLIFGLAALARPVTQALLPLVLGALALQPRLERRRLAAIGLVCVGFLVAVGPGLVRNRIVHGATAISGGMGDSLMERVRRHDAGFELRDRSEAPADLPPAQIRNRIYELARLPEGVTTIRRTVREEFGLSDVEADAALREAAIHLIRQQPEYYLQGTAAMFLRVLVGVERPLDEFWRRRGNPYYAADRATVEQVVGLYQDGHLGGLVGALFLLGTVRTLVAWRRGFWLLPLVVVSHLLLYVALDGPLARYRYPVQPLITLLACGGLALLGWLALDPIRRWLSDRQPYALVERLTSRREPGRVPGRGHPPDRRALVAVGPDDQHPR
jgi:4-amino-4-deoxy-L-arabinose transferase-like glycosyltransferase